MAEKDLTKLSQTEATALYSERIQMLFKLNPDEAKSYAERLYQHYKRLNNFPLTVPTLDASAKVLIKMWKEPGKAESQ